jgi:hypothetical protein
VWLSAEKSLSEYKNSFLSGVVIIKL